ncbi:hypothetical protein Mgra_00001103 [Meloidogyne graminicola]|uniref:Uncharacterized protein n=1 Tax=Meloidogyne graminicola TaxID=189291 RepID=A0A8T0A2A8_9BILA|nr:hypothetical protein Mgra_00001103 [Meloidogyne graminicola]
MYVMGKSKNQLIYSLLILSIGQKMRYIFSVNPAHKKKNKYIKTYRKVDIFKDFRKELPCKTLRENNFQIGSPPKMEEKSDLRKL